MPSESVVNAPSAVTSPEGRRVLIAVVTGSAGAEIQHWRERHDPAQAHRLPPHTTLCYWVPSDVELDRLEAQVRYAFAAPVEVHLGASRKRITKNHTFYVAVAETESLDRARQLLYDGSSLDLGQAGDWRWHVSCVRYGARRDLDELRAAARTLVIDAHWRIARIACMELRGSRYEPLATWEI